MQQSQRVPHKTGKQTQLNLDPVYRGDVYIRMHIILSILHSITLSLVYLFLYQLKRP
jgi:hypothetical protein